MEEKNRFIYKNQNDLFFSNFPNDDINTIKFIPQYIGINNTIKLSKYKIIKDDEVFLYE